MILTGVSQLTGVEHQMEFPLSEDEFNDLYDVWKTKNTYIQDTFHMLSAEQREFIMTGITPEEWDEYFEEEEV